MEHATVSLPATSQPAKIDTAKEDADIIQFERLTVPGLASGPLLPKWLSGLFRRTDTQAAR